MSEGLIRLLDEHTVVAPIRKLSKGCTDLRVAVAFWGKGGTKTLSLAKAKKGRVLCNLESGACNPEEIRAIRSSKTLQIRTHAQLHAKIYWSPKAAVIGSSNASTNGLVVDAKTAKGWREANIWIGDPLELKRIGLRFIELWKQGRRVTNNLLVDAEMKWSSRAKETKELSIESKSLLAAFAESPGAFTGEKIYLAIYDANVSREASAVEDKMRASRSVEKFADGLLAKSSGVTAYEDWYKFPPGAWLIDCSFKNPKKPRVYGIYRVWQGGTLKLKNSAVQFAYKTPSVLIGSRSFKLSPGERRTIEKNASKLYQAACKRPNGLLEISAIVRLCHALSA